MIDAGLTWEESGYPDYDGVAWYRRTVGIPEWREGSSVRLNASGVDDEYDLYINGDFVRHYGQAPDRSVWGWRPRTEVGSALRYGQGNTIAIRVVDWGGGGGGGIWRAIELRREVPLAPGAASATGPASSLPEGGEHPSSATAAVTTTIQNRSPLTLHIGNGNGIGIGKSRTAH